MAVRELRATVRRRNGVAVVDLAGDIDRASDAPLQRAYDEAAAGGAGTLLLNFGDVGYINSTGIAVIVGLLARARTERRAVAAYGLSDHYRQIFTITRLSDFIGLFPDEDTAVGGPPRSSNTQRNAPGKEGGER
jgi:anti-anti-sigma factor